MHLLLAGWLVLDRTQSPTAIEPILGKQHFQVELLEVPFLLLLMLLLPLLCTHRGIIQKLTEIFLSCCVCRYVLFAVMERVATRFLSLRAAAVDSGNDDFSTMDGAFHSGGFVWLLPASQRASLGESVPSSLNSIEQDFASSIGMKQNCRRINLSVERNAPPGTELSVQAAR